MPPYVTAVLKRRIVGERLMYKIQWCNGSISYEPFRTMDPEMLQNVETWELEQHYKTIEPPKPVIQQPIVVKESPPKKKKVTRAQQKKQKLKKKQIIVDPPEQPEQPKPEAVMNEVKLFTVRPQELLENTEEQYVILDDEDNHQQPVNVEELIMQYMPKLSAVQMNQLSTPCEILESRKSKVAPDQLEFLVRYQEQEAYWATAAELKQKSSKTFCDYLLQKLNWGVLRP